LIIILVDTDIVSINYQRETVFDRKEMKLMIAFAYIKSDVISRKYKQRYLERKMFQIAINEKTY